MVRQKNKFPKQGEFIVGKVVDIQNQYVYVDLVDYDGLDSEECARGMIHISEISSRWIKSIRSFVRINQRVVLRVVRVEEEKGHIDLSLRRVNSAQAKVRIKEWKYGVKYENLLQFLVEERPEMNLDQVYDLIGFPILEFFTSYQEAIEELKENGEEILKHVNNVPDDVKTIFLKIVNENVNISTVSIIGKIKLIIATENGMDIIRNMLIKARDTIEKPKETRKITISYIGAPYYRMEIIAKDYLDAENIKEDALEIIKNEALKYEGVFEFVRD